MARRKDRNGEVNKSAAIRAICEQNPKISVKEVVAALEEKGVGVQPSLVYFVKGKMKRAKRKQIGQSMAKAGIANPVELILRVRGLAQQAGGMTKLKQLVDALVE